MTETLLNILQWAVPSGGIGAAVAWIVNRGAHQARQARDVHDTYKTMYQDISRLLIETRKKYDQLQETLSEVKEENASLRRSVNRLERCISKAKACRYYDDCPIRDELRNEKASAQQERQPQERQRRGRDRGKKDAAQGECVDDKSDDTEGPA